MAVKSRRGVAIGALVALSIPVAYLALTVLLQAGIPVIVREGSTMNTLTSIALLEIVLGPLGLVIVGASIPIRSALAWLIWLVAGIFLLAILWFYAAALLSGALGSPF